MNPLDFLESEELVRFLHCSKTQISCMENPNTFLRQLMDHNLIPEDKYKKVTRMKSKENIKTAIYDILDWLERERSEHIHLFWTCVFKEHILNNYPTLVLLRNSLMDGSYHFQSKLPAKFEAEERNKRERKDLSENEEPQLNSVEKKRKLRHKSVCGDDEEEEQPGPSSHLTAGQRKKSKKICFTSPLKKGEKSDIWTWPIYKSQLPVTCGDKEGLLKKDRLAKGEKCILVKNRWFTPSEFERFAGKESSKNWKLSIRCMNTTLGKLIQDGHLKTVNSKRQSNTAKKSLFPPDHSNTDTEGEEDENEEEEGNQEDQVLSSENVTDEEEEMEEETELQPETSHDRSKSVFQVTCGGETGMLYKTRFASGTRGKSIRTETSWMSPVDFMKKASCETDCWKKDIEWQGQPLNVLIEEEILRIHSLLCTCELCSSEPQHLEDQKNDDECCVCKSEEKAEELVECDHCPRSFHQTCHLPHVGDSTLRDDKPWMCTFCIFKTSQECRYSDQLEMEVVMSRQISQHILECHYLLLFLCNADEEQFFATDPRTYLEDYSALIKTPMWLTKVADKLQREQYQVVANFVSDVQLIFTNCARYNQNNAEFLAKGDQLKLLFDAELKKAFNIH